MKALAFLLLMLPTLVWAQTANLWIDTDGGTCTRQGTPASYSSASACASMDAAIDACTAGDTIRMKAGTYGAQTINRTKTTPGCTIIAETTTTIGNLETNGAWYEIQNINMGDWGISAEGTNHITCRDCNLDAGGASNAVDWNITGSASAGVMYSYISWIGGTFSNYTTESYTIACAVCVRTKGDAAGSSQYTVNDILIDGITFDDIQNTGGDVNHFEVIRVDGNINNITIKNNTFKSNNNVSTALIFFTSFLGGKPNNVVLENNFMDMTSNQPWLIQMNYQGSYTCENFTYRYNTFKKAAGFDATSGGCSGSAFSNFAWLGNIIQRGDCSGANTFSYNLGFGDSGSACSGTGNAVAATAAMNFDTDGFHITSGSAAIDAGAPSGASCIATDIDGNSRPVGDNCDAGAHEYGAGSSPPNAPSNFRLVSWAGWALLAGLLAGMMGRMRHGSDGNPGGTASARRRLGRLGGAQGGRVAGQTVT